VPPGHSGTLSAATTMASRSTRLFSIGVVQNGKNGSIRLIIIVLIAFDFVLDSADAACTHKFGRRSAGPSVFDIGVVSNSDSCSPVMNFHGRADQWN
jgi:hypothetical protein